MSDECLGQKGTGMPLTRYGFIVIARGFDPMIHRHEMKSPEFQMVVVGVATTEEAHEVARQMVRDDIELLELCGGFEPEDATAVFEAIDRAIPVGAVTHSLESQTRFHALFEP
ncbi:MAG: hypothetical protein GY946_05835 [bacterium]|nr:hypothetical protein [bacterium]